jgi:hypothetical protein
MVWDMQTFNTKCLRESCHKYNEQLELLLAAYM